MTPIDAPSGPLVSGPRRGVVADFDEAGGYGIVAEAGVSAGSEADRETPRRWFFHCTAIADGSRTIEVGAEVAFEVEPGRMGRFEAVRVQPA